jgi:hypothetical protein
MAEWHDHRSGHFFPFLLVLLCIFPFPFSPFPFPFSFSLPSRFYCLIFVSLEYEKMCTPKTYTADHKSHKEHSKDTKNIQEVSRGYIIHPGIQMLKF